MLFAGLKPPDDHAPPCSFKAPPCNIEETALQNSVLKESTCTVAVRWHTLLSLLVKLHLNRDIIH